MTTTPTRNIDAGQFRLDLDDSGRPFWRGSGPDDKDESIFNYGDPLVLSPYSWPVGTVITATVPDWMSHD